MPVLPFVQNPYASPTPYIRPMPVQPVWQQAPRPPAQVPAAMAEHSAPRPKIRMQAPEPTTTSARLSLPSPEQLGLSPIRTSAGESVDWNLVRTRLDKMGAVGFHLDKLNQGGTRVRFFLPAGQPNSTQHIEAAADTEAAALRLALDRAEAFARNRR